MAFCDSFYEPVAAAFDRAAETYDALYRNNPVMAWMRSESLAVFRETFPSGARLLEVGCGTGDEALALSRLGYRIVATDLSPRMIRLARTKDVAGAVEWRVLPAGEIGQLLDDYGPAAFDGAYASFGALNCEPHLEEFAAALGELLRPGAAFVCSVMNRWCAWEILWGMLHLRPRQAVRRFSRGWIQAGLAGPEGRLTVPTRYYDPRSFACIFAPRFAVRRTLGLPVLLPPPYLDRLFACHRSLFARLESIERRLRSRWPFNALGDHFLMVMVRTEAAP